MQRKGEEAGTGAKGGLCRAEGAEVPVFSWSGIFSHKILSDPCISLFHLLLWRYKGGLPFYQ